VSAGELADSHPVADHQISNVRDPGKEVVKDKNRVPLVEAVSEENEGAGEAQVPKGIGNHDLPLSFRGPPLDKES